MTTPSTAVEWRWTDERGVQRSVRLDELRAALTNKVLAPSTLVWRTGMTEWMPASAVPELSSALPKAQAQTPKPQAVMPAAAAPKQAIANPSPAASSVSSGADASDAMKLKVSGRTLTGMTAPSAPAKEGGRAEMPSIPIVVPAAGGAQDAARRTAITQPPAYSPGAVPAEAMPAIPKANMPSAALTSLVGPASGPVSGRGERVSLWPEQSFEDEEEIVSTFVDDGKDAGKHEALPPPKAAAPAPAAKAAPANESPKAAKPPVRAPNPAGFSPKDTMPGLGTQKSGADVKKPSPADDSRGGFPPLLPRKEAPKAASPAPAPAAAEKPAAFTPAKPPVQAAKPKVAPVELTKPMTLPAAAEMTKPMTLPTAPSPVPAAPAASPSPAANAAKTEHTGRFTPMRPEQVIGASKAQAVFGVRAASPLPAHEKTSTTALLSTTTAASAASAVHAPPVRERENEGHAAVSAAPKPVPEAPKPKETSATAVPAAAPPQVKESPAAAKAAPPKTAAPIEPKPAPKAETPAAAPEDKHQRFTPTAPLAAVSSPELAEPPNASAASSSEAHATETQKLAPVADALPSAAAQAPPIEAAAPAPTKSQEKTALPPIGAEHPSHPSHPSMPAMPGPADRRSNPSADAQRIAALSGLPLPPTSTIRTRPRPPAESAPAQHPASSQRHFTEPVSVSMSSLLTLGGALVAMTVAAFLVGRCSIGSSGTTAAQAPPKLKAALSLAALAARAGIPKPFKPCWVSRQPVRWAARADKSVPFDLFSPRPGVFALGYARSENAAAGVEIDAATGNLTERLSTDTESPIERVAPSLDSAGFVVVTESQVTSIAPIAYMPHPESPFFVGAGGSAVTLSTKVPDSEPQTLFPMQGEGDANAIRAISLGNQGYAVVYRKGMSIWGGIIDRDRKASGGLVQIVGSGGGAVGKPMSGFNGKEYAVIFADRPEPGSSYEMRVGISPVGSIPSTTTVIPLPKGGPGGDAFSPDIAGLSDGRWLLVWTEGSPGNRAIRAQTLAPDLVPLGDPIALSPPAGNFGQGVLGVTEGYVSVVFLQQGKAGYELWGAMLQCS